MTRELARMPDVSYEITDRRPLKSRGWALSNRAARRLAAWGASANAISVGGMFAAWLAGVALVGTALSTGWAARALWLAAAALCQLRLTANLLDGMVAVERGTASAVGELYNDLPDRAADAAVFVGLGCAAGGVPWLGWAAALGAVMTAYVRCLGKTCGAPADFGGPMAKQHRMLAVTLLGLTGAAMPSVVRDWHLAAWVAGAVAVGTVITSIMRLRRTARALRAAGVNRAG